VANNYPETYREAGFSAFLRRSIDSPMATVQNLSDYARGAQLQTRAINFDNAPLSGTLSDVIKIGDKIALDGNVGRLSFFDDNHNEVGRIGKLRDE
jgi:hypothetical protein